VDDAALKHIAAACQRLALLQVGGCTKITDDGVVAFCEEVKRHVPAPTRDNLLPDAALVKLSLMNCSQLTNKSLAGVAELLPQLRDLCIYGCYRMNDDALIRFKRTSCLSKLNTSGCYKITDMSLRYLMQVRARAAACSCSSLLVRQLTRRSATSCRSAPRSSSTTSTGTSTSRSPSAT